MGFAFAQFDSLSTTRDGSRVYFTTRLVQNGSQQPKHGKAFVADRAGVRPLLIRNRDFFAAYPPSTGLSNYFDIVGVQPSADVDKLAIVAEGDCNVGSVCAYSYSAGETTIYDGQGNETSFLGRAVLSPNGAWALSTYLPRANPSPSFSVSNVATDSRYPVMFTGSRGRDWQLHDVADNGTAVIATDELTIFSPPASVQKYPGRPESAVIDAAGTTVVWTDTADGPRSLRVLKIAERRIRSLATPDRYDYAPSLSDDGSRILFLSEPRRSADGLSQAFLMRIDGAERRQITADPDGIRSAVLSGDGRIAWVLTQTGRLIQVDIDGGNATEVIARTPVFLTGTATAAIGQVVSAAASVLLGDAVEVRVDGRPTPVLAVERGAVKFQMPWDIEDFAEVDVALSSQDAGSWSGAPLRIRVRTYDPVFVTAPGSEYAVAAHQSFQGLVTSEQPARRGEIIHLYATGLGPVVGESPATVAAPLTCSVDGTSIQLLYAGLAPGIAGYYQVSVRLPEATPSDFVVALTCELATAYRFAVRLPVQR